VYRRPRCHNEIYRTIELWRTSPTEAEQPYVFLNGMRRSQRIVARRNARVFREILGICEGAKEAAAGWSASVEHLRECGPKELPLIVSDAFLGRSESAAEFYRGGVGKVRGLPVSQYVQSRAFDLRPRSGRLRDAQGDPHRGSIPQKAFRLSLLSKIFQGFSPYLSNLVAEQTDCDCDGAENADEHATDKSYHEQGHCVCSLSFLEAKATKASVNRDVVRHASCSASPFCSIVTSVPTDSS
jgi:hypothetical protein